MLKENFILIKNVSEADIVTIISNLANLYADSGFTQGIELSKKNNSNQEFFVTFRNPPDLDHFAFCVNYVFYPEGFDSLQPFVNGFYQIKDNESTADFKQGEWLQLYVSKNDTAYDNVYIVNRTNESFLFDFGGKTKKLSSTEEKYHLPEIDRSEYSIVKIIDAVREDSQKGSKSSKPWWKFW